MNKGVVWMVGLAVAAGGITTGFIFTQKSKADSDAIVEKKLPDQLKITIKQLPAVTPAVHGYVDSRTITPVPVEIENKSEVPMILPTNPYFLRVLLYKVELDSKGRVAERKLITDTIRFRPSGSFAKKSTAFFVLPPKKSARTHFIVGGLPPNIETGSYSLVAQLLGINEEALTRQEKMELLSLESKKKAVPWVLRSLESESIVWKIQTR